MLDEIAKAVGTPIVERRKDFNVHCGDYDIYTWPVSHFRIYYRAPGNAEDELTRLQLRLGKGKLRLGVRPYLEVPRG